MDLLSKVEADAMMPRASWTAGVLIAAAAIMPMNTAAFSLGIGRVGHPALLRTGAHTRASPYAAGGALREAERVARAGAFAAGLRPHVRRASRTAGGVRMGIEGTGIYVGTSLYAGQWKSAVVVNSVLAVVMFLTGKYKSALTEQGLLHAWILGVLLWGPLGFGAWVTCVCYLVCGSLVTKVSRAETQHAQSPRLHACLPMCRHSCTRACVRVSTWA